MTRVLVPVEVLEGEAVSSGLMNLLGTMDVTVLGYHVLPEQTPPDQARAQYEERASSALEDIAEEFRAAGGDADYRLVFTHDGEKTIDRVADETGSEAFAVTGATGDVDRLLVALSGDVAADRIVAFVEELVGDRDIAVTLLLVAEDTPEAGQLLEEASDRLEDAGIDAETRLATGKPVEVLLDTVPGHDAIVMGEQAPSFRSLIFGEESEHVAEASVGPVLVVRYEDVEESSD